MAQKSPSMRVFLIKTKATSSVIFFLATSAIVMFPARDSCFAPVSALHLISMIVTGLAKFSSSLIWDSAIHSNLSYPL